MTNTTNQEPANGHEGYSYFEVDIEYVTQAKMVMMGKDEEDIRQVIMNGLDIPGVKILSISPADEDLVREAKARREFEESVMNETKNMVN